MGPDDIQQVFDKIARDLEQHLQTISTLPNSQQTMSLRTLLEYVLHARNGVRDANSTLALLLRAVEGLVEGLNLSTGDSELMLRYRDCHIMVLRAINDPRLCGPPWTTKQVTRYKFYFIEKVFSEIYLVSKSSCVWGGVIAVKLS